MAVISDEEFRRNSRDADDILAAAVLYAIGAATVCWSEDGLRSAGEFDAARAATISEDLTRYLRNTHGLVSKGDLAWLLTLISNAKPRYPGSPGRDWEGAGRARAAEILTAALEPERKRRVPVDHRAVLRGQDRIAKS